MAKVLIVEDDQAMAVALRDGFTYEGYEVRMAHDGASGLKSATEGNPDLIPAYLDNFDLRWDWYFDQGEFVSLGAFYKEFRDPIETVILAGASQITTYNNAKAAENLGIEFELYTDLDFIGRWWGEAAWWEKWYVNTNYAWIDSTIELSPEDANVLTSASRPLQGQSQYVWNFQIGYDDLDRVVRITYPGETVELAFVDQGYFLEVAAIGAMYAPWLGYGAGVTNYLSVPDMPLDVEGTEFGM